MEKSRKKALVQIFLSNKLDLPPKPEVDGSATGSIQAPPTPARVVKRRKLDPSLKATCFQPLNLRVHTLLSP